MCQILYSLVATEIIIFYLKKVLAKINSMAVTPDIVMNKNNFDQSKFMKALEFSKLTNKKYPGLCKWLELGNNWEDTITKIIAACHM